MHVQGAEEMAQMEHLLNVYASRVAKGSIADFVGYVEVAEDEATTRLTQGVWLVSNISLRLLHMAMTDSHACVCTERLLSVYETVLHQTSRACIFLQHLTAARLLGATLPSCLECGVMRKRVVADVEISGS